MENTNTNTNKFKVILEANAGENYTLYKLHDSEHYRILCVRLRFLLYRVNIPHEV